MAVIAAVFTIGYVANGLGEAGPLSEIEVPAPIIVWLAWPVCSVSNTEGLHAGLPNSKLDTDQPVPLRARRSISTSAPRASAVTPMQVRAGSLPGAKYD
jgi:hypothetical protein